MNAMLDVIIQNVSTEKNIPSEAAITAWVLMPLKQRIDNGELTVRIVDTAESQALNKQYRHKDKATNVLAFPFAAFPDIDISDPIIGDVVICAAIVNQEAEQQAKNHAEHWAHIVIHGVLHLLGYDHIEATDASVMEALEIDLLQQLGYANPYE